MARARQHSRRAPIPRPEISVKRAEYRGGNGPNTRNPAGGADGVGLAASGGIAANFPRQDSGDRGDCCPRDYPLVARRPRKVQGRHHTSLSRTLMTC
jgi:hypothetical protein